MSRKYRKKDSSKLLGYVFIGMIAAVVVLIIAGLILSAQTSDSGYVITEDGHVHDAAGNHIGDYDELFGEEGLTVTEDGHIHDAEGNHVGDVSDTTTTEESAEPTAEPATEEATAVPAE